MKDLYDVLGAGWTENVVSDLQLPASEDLQDRQEGAVSPALPRPFRQPALSSRLAKASSPQQGQQLVPEMAEALSGPAGSDENIKVHFQSHTCSFSQRA